MQELIVVTLLVAAQGKLQLPRITSREELVTALNRLGAVREDQVHYLPAKQAPGSVAWLATVFCTEHG